MLRRGGNAVDAAVAAAFMSFFAEIGMVHWGGSGLANVYDPATKQFQVFDFFSNMPGLGLDALPSPLDFEQVSIQFSATSQHFHLGRASVAVPGNLFGLCKLAAQKGTLPLNTLLEPVITATQDGIPINQYQANICKLLAPLYTHTASVQRIFAPRGTLLQAGDRLYIPDLPELLSELAETGPALLRHGRLGTALCRDQAERGGLVTATDLEQYRVERKAALRVRHRGYELLLPPPSSIGGLLMAFSFGLLAQFDAGRFGVNSAETHQLTYEILQATSRARAQLEKQSLGDDISNHIDHFLSSAFQQPFIDQVAQAMQTRQPTQSAPVKPSHPNTSHISVIDGKGMAVALTTTAGESAGYVVPGTGFIPNNMLGEADLNPHGWHQWRPGQRIPTMMSPTIVLKDGKVVLATGSGGSERIRSALLQVIGNLIDHGLSAQDAVNQPRIHVEKDVMQCEGGVDSAAMDQLAAWGYPLNRWPNTSMYFGGAHSVVVEGDDVLVGSADFRRDGHVAIA